MTLFQAPPVEIIGSGPGWLVTDKPAGLSVHNDPGRDLCSLLNAFIKGDPQAAAALDCEPGFGVNAVHRLDRGTSGLIVLACRRDAFEVLACQFSQGLVQKEYLALVHGRIDPPPTNPWGVWDRPLAKTSGGRADIQGSDRRLESRTRYSVERQSRRYTLLRCCPLTGRRHQIRRHAALAGHAVLGDRRYGSARACRYLQQHQGFSRLALHAARLRLQPLQAETPMDFQSPRLPQAIEALLAADA